MQSQSKKESAMKISSVYIQNFRKLYRCYIDFSDTITLFVGANNSGKTSAIDALGKFLASRAFVFNDFTVSNRKKINEIGALWTQQDCAKPDSIADWENILPSMDIWLNVMPQDIHYVVNIIPTLQWREGVLGVRLLFQPKDIGNLFNNYRDAYNAARQTEKATLGTEFHLFPKNLCDFLEKKLTTFFSIMAYILDPSKQYNDPPQSTKFEMGCFTDNPLRNIVRIDMISAQRGFSDADTPKGNEVSKISLSSQMRKYYERHLDPEKIPTPEDLKILESTKQACDVFNKSLTDKFTPALEELEHLGYPGISNPRIKIASKVSATETLNHEAAVQYSLAPQDDEFMLPEKYNGLGYQNLISIVFDLISFRDSWMRKGKAKIAIQSDKTFIEPLHLVLIEEPEAHLHAQVQQVFIRKAYNVLRNHENLHDKTDFTTQLIVSTHSSYIAKETTFNNLRYFKRLSRTNDCNIRTSKVINLSDVFGGDNKTNKFVTRYLQTTHCDLFFADGAILVEGIAENMLLPHFIKNKYEWLEQCYISTLCINGKHSYRLAPLLEKLALPTLVIADLDAAKSDGHHEKVIPERGKGLISGNYAITNWIMDNKDLDILLNMSSENMVKAQVRIAYQQPIEIDYNGKKIEALARTFEDSLIYSNLETFKNTEIEAGTLLSKVYEELNKSTSWDDFQKIIFNELKKSDRKAEFALDLIYSLDPAKLQVPAYINAGLTWLQTYLNEEHLA